MRPRAEHRVVLKFLRQHGARHARIVAGRRHPRLNFEFGGKEYSRPIAGSTSDRLGMQWQVIRDLKKMLGTKENRTPEHGHVALYHDGRLRLTIPRHMADIFGKNVAAARKLSDDTWELYPCPEIAHGPKLRPYGRYMKLDVSGMSGQPFESTPAEYIQVDDRLMVHIVGRLAPFIFPSTPMAEETAPVVEETAPTPPIPTAEEVPEAKTAPTFDEIGTVAFYRSAIDTFLRFNFPEKYFNLHGGYFNVTRNRDYQWILTETLDRRRIPHWSNGRLILDVKDSEAILGLERFGTTRALFKQEDIASTEQRPRGVALRRVRVTLLDQPRPAGLTREEQLRKAIPPISPAELAPRKRKRKHAIPPVSLAELEPTTPPATAPVVTAATTAPVTAPFTASPIAETPPSEAELKSALSIIERAYKFTPYRLVWREGHPAWRAPIISLDNGGNDNR